MYVAGHKAYNKIIKMNFFQGTLKKLAVNNIPGIEEVVWHLLCEIFR